MVAHAPGAARAPGGCRTHSSLQVHLASAYGGSVFNAHAFMPIIIVYCVMHPAGLQPMGAASLNAFAVSLGHRIALSR